MSVAIEAPVLRGSEAAVLGVIVDPAIQMALWTRPPAVALDEATLLDVDDIEQLLQMPVQPGELAVLLAEAGYPEAQAAGLAFDIHARAEQFAGIAGAGRLLIKLQVVETDACRKFHADYVTLRLLTTYRGRGTQWQTADAPDVVAEMDEGNVAIFKGRLLCTTQHVLHRSPPIEAAGERRLLLVIDPA